MRETPQTTETLIDLYDQLYKIQGKKQHPRKIRDGKLIMLGRYGEATTRNLRFLKFIKKNISAGALVHDAGCGRGYLLRGLLDAGYDASGTDCAASLFYQELGKFTERQARMCPYSDLQVLGLDCFDAVISNDVLEHLVDEDAVDQALENLVAITKDWLLVSVGTGRARNYPSTHRGLGVNDLHSVRRPAGWWQERLNRHVEHVWHLRTKVNWFSFGRKRKS